MVMYGHVGCHGKSEGGFPYRRTGTDDDEFGILKSAGIVIELSKPGGDAGVTFFRMIEIGRAHV